MAPRPWRNPPVFFNRFGPASDPYLRRICTPHTRTPAALPPGAPANPLRRRTLAALSLAAALASPLLAGGRASAQQVEEPGDRDVTERAPALPAGISPAPA